MLDEDVCARSGSPPPGRPLARGARAGSQRSPGYTKSPTLVAAESELQKAARREDEARREFASRARATAAAEREAKERAEADRAKHEEIKELRRLFFDTLSGEVYQRIEEMVGDTVTEWNVRMNVTWKSSPENRNALVYYQTKRARERGDAPISLGNPTETTAALPMGRYYVWAARRGSCTSDSDRLFLITKDDSQTLRTRGRARAPGAAGRRRRPACCGAGGSAAARR